MAEIIAIASGKGGVGKSFLSSSLALSLSAAGKSVLLVDGDLGGANLHNFLGYKIPPMGLYDFLREKISIDDIITKTPVGIDFIAGSGDILGMAHITTVERSRFIDKLHETNYEIVILDLGAGTSYNTIDLFNLSNKKIIVMNSEPTSIENAYGFLKIAVYRYLERFLAGNDEFAEISKKLRSKSVSFPDIDAVLAAVLKIDPKVASDILNFVNNYKAGIVLNLVKYKKELNVFHGFETIMKKYLRITIEKLGFIPYDEKVVASIRLMKPFYYYNKDSGTADCIDDIREMVFTKL